ncbi:MAG: hypothetical protein RL368_1878, partial [Pseudomonadota bacterium]
MSKLFEQLHDFLPADAVLLSEEAVRPYECDGLFVYRERPAAVVIPETLEQVQQVLKFCYTHKIPIVARGAGTG